MSYRANTLRHPRMVEPPAMRVEYTGWFSHHERRVTREALERWDARKARGTLVGRRWWQPLNGRWTGRSYLPHAVGGIALIFVLGFIAAALSMP